MRNIFNSKLKLAGIATALVLLFGLAYLTGTVSGSHNAASAQSAATPTAQATSAPTIPATTAAPTTTEAANSQESGEEPDGTPGASGNKGAESSQSEAAEQAALAAQAKITADQAKQTALGKVPGTLVSSKLENENGKVVYALVVTPTAGGANQEVKVDATDGKILAVDTEGAEHTDGNHNEGQD